MSECQCKYVLISFYPVRREGNNGDETEVWLTYGHIHGGRSEKLKEFGTRREAIDFCFGYTDVPVMEGSNCTYITDIVDQLSMGWSPVDPHACG